MNLIGSLAPDFTTAVVNANGEIVNNFNFAEAIKNKYALVFFYPLDFTFVCPSELIALHNRMNKFKELGVEVFAVSIDSQFTHLAWRNTPVEKGGIGALDYTLVADIQRKICQSYGVLHNDAGVALRAAFLIDKNGIIRSQIMNDLPLGRNIDEIIRLFDAIQFNEQFGEVCPANWQKGKKGMKANQEGVAKYLAEEANTL